jgi:hypothetical protein
MALKVSMHNWMRPEPIETTISRLAEAGYDLRGCELVDLFPHTSHVEVVARFDRR